MLLNAPLQAGVVIFGGGVAGLWTLCRLRRAGISALLFEAESLGGRQSLASQGILHSGLKYTLDGMVSGQPSILSEMLPIWNDALQGRGELDLSATQIRSPHTYFFSSGLSLGGFMAPLMLKSRVETLKNTAEFPQVFQHPKFSGRISRIQEQVLDVKSLMRSFATLAGGAVHHGRFAGAGTRDAHGRLTSANVTLPDGQTVEIAADAFVFCGGEGNEQAAALLGWNQPVGQVRPLGMIIAESAPGELFGHCIVNSKRPRATITTHPGPAGSVWYIGGNIAEEASRMNDADALTHARHELQSIFPWHSWAETPLRIHRVNRAEPKQSALVLPEGPRLRSESNVTLAWPTKLVLAPALARCVYDWFATLNIAPRQNPPLLFPAPPTGNYPWE